VIAGIAALSYGCCMTPVRLSIVIPTHNRPKLLPRALRSALENCPDDGEVIVVDDASNPPAADCLADVSDPRLRLIENPGPHGASAARNLGAAEARGDILLFLDDDDEFLPGYPAMVLDVAARAREASYGYSAVVIREPGAPDRLRKRIDTTGLIPQGARIRRKIAGTGNGFWIRREVFLAAGGLDPQQVLDEDTDLCVRLTASGHRVWHSAKPGVIVNRAHGDAGQLTTGTAADRTVACYRRSYAKVEGRLPALGEARRYLALRYLRVAVRHGEAAEASAFIRAQKPPPFRMLLRAYWLIKLAARSRA
jgi:glycosyltransferase involved in cell wall biosynthesis